MKNRLRLENAININAILEVYIESEDFLSLGPKNKASIEMVNSDINYSKSHGYKYYEIKIENETIGICDFCISGFEDIEENGYINLIMIKENKRNMGYGKLILGNIEKEIAHCKTNKIIAFVQTNNMKAIKFWENNGYQKTSNEILNEDMTIVYRMEKVFGK